MQRKEERDKRKFQRWDKLREQMEQEKDYVIEDMELEKVTGGIRNGDY